MAIRRGIGKALPGGQARNVVVSTKLYRVVPGDLERGRAYRGSPRQVAAIDSSTAYGCVDWYLYPDAARAEHAADARAGR